MAFAKRNKPPENYSSSSPSPSPREAKPPLRPASKVSSLYRESLPPSKLTSCSGKLASKTIRFFRINQQCAIFVYSC